MSMIDERGQNRPRPAIAEGDIVARFRCDECGGVTLVTKSDRKAIVAKLDPKYPARTVTLNCPCGIGQYVVQAKARR